MRDEKKTKQQLMDELTNLRKRISKLESRLADEKQEKESFRETKDRLDLALQGSNLDLWDWNVQTGELLYDERWAEVLGYSRGELIPRLDSWESLIHLDDRPRILESIRKHQKDLMPLYRAEYRLRTKEGGWHWVLSCGRISQRDGEGKPLRMIGVFLDINERKRAEEELLESREATTSLLKGFRDVAALVDKDGIFLDVNKAMAQRFHSRAEDLIGVYCWDLFPPEVADQRKTYMNEVLRSGESVRFEDEREGTWFDNVFYPVFDTQGNVTRVAVLARDITERKGTEKALQRSEARYRSLFETMAQGVVYQNADGEITSANPSAEKILGLSLEEMGGRTSLDLRWRAIHEGGSEFPGETHPSMEALRTGRPVKDVVMGFFNHLENDYRWINVNATPQFRPGEEKPHQVYTTFNDITDQKQAEEAQRQSEERYRVIYDTAPLAFVIWDRDCRVTGWNDCAEKTFGWTREEILGQDFFEFLIPESVRPRIEDVVKTLLKGEIEHDVVNENLTKSGDIIVCQWNNSILHDRAGNILGVISMGYDITEKKRMEEELLRAQKLDSVGILAGGIAHDFNNILTPILANISIAKSYGVFDPEITELLTDAEKASLRAKSLTQQLLTFSRGGAPVRKPVSLHRTLKDSADLALSGSNVRCECSLPETLWPVEIDEGQIGQVFHNIVINADQAMPEGGTIEIRAENVRIESKDLLPLKQGKYVKVSFKDHGIGVPEKLLEKIFDPFFTTKDRGSGLGLSISFSIINRHNGAIRVESGMDAGTTVHVYLPATGKNPIGEGTEGRKSLRGEGRIPVVDDEEFVRRSAGEILKRLGYDVDYAEDGREGISLYQKAMESGRPFRAVIMDLTIPGGMGGRRAVKKLLNVDPAAVVIVSSGYSDDPVLSNYREHGFSGVVAKPYTMEELGEALRTRG